MPTQNQRIVFVEDDGFLAGIYAQKLQREGFEVLLATNGEDGVRLISKEKPFCVILDLLLPKLNGFQVLERLKSDPETSEIPVFILSNLGQREDIERCLALGAKGYAIKAHSLPQDLLAKIRELT